MSTTTLKAAVRIDGSQGEGGGQVVRTAIALSAITGKPLVLEFIRAGRKKPGIMRQHLTSIQAAAQICHAKTVGVELGAEDIEFIPGEIEGGDYNFKIGSAGSTSLVAQAIMPILAMASEPSNVTISGGTHNLWAPTYDFIDQSFLPLFRQMGARVQGEITMHGFFPAGGGEIKLEIKPLKKSMRLDLCERGEALKNHAVVLLSHLKHAIGERELERLNKNLDFKSENCEILHVKSPGPGNAVTIFAEFENVTGVFVSLGQHGVRAEAVAATAGEEVRDYLANDAAVCTHLADQLLLPMALMGGGSFTTTDISEHTRTNAEIIKKFLDVSITWTQQKRKKWLIEIIK